MHTEEQPIDPASQPSGAQRSAAGPQRPLLPLSRILLFLLLALMIGAWVVDHQARSAAEAAFKTLDTALGPINSAAQVTRDEVHRLVGRQPDAEGESDKDCEQYSWQGVPFKRTVYVEYRHGEVSTMKNVTLNEAPR